MSISDKNHNLISPLARGIAQYILDTMNIASQLGLTMPPPEHICAYDHPEESEELIIRMQDVSVSIKISIKDIDYLKDIGDVLEDSNIDEMIDHTINTILGNIDKENDEG